MPMNSCWFNDKMENLNFSKTDKLKIGILATLV